MARKRVDVRAILADQDLRRELMVSTIQATQAREGIETTTEQAHRAYTIANQADKAVFFALDQFKAARGREDGRECAFVANLGAGKETVRFDIPRSDFGVVEGAPLAFE